MDKALFFISMIFIIIMLAISPLVIAYPSCGSHFFTKVSYADDKTTPQEAEKTSLFTTEDYRAICRVYVPLNCYELDFVWYDPFNNSVRPTGPLGASYFYEQGVLYCVEGYFYISGENRELGQYRVELYAREHQYWPQYLLFTDYFQICVNETFQVNVGGTIFNVTVLSNSTLSNFNFNETEKKITFNVTGPDDTLGFCNVTIPNSLFQDLWQDNCTVLVDGKQPLTIVNWTDGTYTYIYFTYLHSEHEVVIISEFPTWTSMLLILIVLTVAIAIYKRRLPKTAIH